MTNKPITYKGWKINLEDDRYQVYTKDEWAHGKGYRYPEYDAGSVAEAKEFIDCY